LDFLFKKGDVDMPGQFITRHSVRGLGELYWFQLPLILSGILALISLKKRKELILFLWWLVLYPLGSVITADVSPQATRSIIGVIPFQILSAIGFSYFYQNGVRSDSDLVKKISVIVCARRLERTLKFTILALAFLLLIGISTVEFFRYTYLYFIEYSKYSSDYWSWQWGFKEIMEDFSKRKGYDELLITHRFNRGETLLKFYQVTIPCPKCQIALNPITFNPAKRQFFAVRKEGLRELEAQGAEFITKKILHYPNGGPAFFIGEVVTGY